MIRRPPRSTLDRSSAASDVYKRWIVDNIPLAVNAFSPRVGLGFGVSLLNIGSGMIIGLRISASMLIGGIIGWVIAPPWLLSRGLIAADARRVDILLLIMWPAVGMLVAGGMSALLLRWGVLVRTFKGLTSSGSVSGDLPLRWVWIGSLAAATFLIVIQARFFGTPVW